MALITEVNPSWVVRSRDLPPEDTMFGGSQAMRAVNHEVEKVVNTTVPILILGETGTGKEIIAKYIHCLSPWAEGLFIKANCPFLRISETEDEGIIGNDEAASETLTRGRAGAEAATIGTLFLNEISMLDPILQLRLLQTIQEGRSLWVAHSGVGKQELRLICATNLEVDKGAVETEKFRQKLLDCLKVVTLHLPPLRRRRCDIRKLTHYFMNSYNDRLRSRVPYPSTQTLRLMERYDWPGNIRQLENLIRRYVILGSEEAIREEVGRWAAVSRARKASPGAALPLKRVGNGAVEAAE